MKTIIALSFLAFQASARQQLRGLQTPTVNVWQLEFPTKEFLDPTTANDCVILKALGSTTGCTYVEGTTSLTYPAWFADVEEITIGTPSSASGATGIIIPANCDFILAGQHIFVGLSCLTPGPSGWDIVSTFYDGVYAIENQVGLFTYLPPAISPADLPYKVSYKDCVEELKPADMTPVDVDYNIVPDVCGFDSVSWNFPSQGLVLGYKISGQTYERLTIPSVTCEVPGSTLTLYYGSHFTTENVPGSSEGQETSWSHTKPPQNGNWGAYSSVTFVCAERPGGDPPGDDDDDYVCETIFGLAENSQCFLGLGLGISRWGWTTLVAPFVETETVSFELWGGAAHCDTDNGVLAGAAEIRSDGSVVYNLADGVILLEYHVYVGNTPVLAFTRGKKTTYSVAPGLYTFGGTSYSDSADFAEVFNNPWTGETVLEGVNIQTPALPSYVILHGVACSQDW